MKLFQRTAKEGNELGDLLEAEKKQPRRHPNAPTARTCCPASAPACWAWRPPARSCGSASSAAPARSSNASWTPPGPTARPAPCARPCSSSPPTPAPPRPAPRPRSPAEWRRRPYRGRPAQPAGLGRRGRCPPERAGPGRPGQRQPRSGQLRRPGHPAPGRKRPERRRRSLQGRPALAAVQRRAGARRRPEPAGHAAAGGRPATAAARPAPCRTMPARCNWSSSSPGRRPRCCCNAVRQRRTRAHRRWTAATRTGS